MALWEKITVKIIGGMQSCESQTNYNYIETERERERVLLVCQNQEWSLSFWERPRVLTRGDGDGAGQLGHSKCTEQVSGREERNSTKRTVVESLLRDLHVCLVKSCDRSFILFSSVPRAPSWQRKEFGHKLLNNWEEFQWKIRKVLLVSNK